VCYDRRMDDRERLKKAVEEAQQKLDAAKRITELNRAAKKLQRARAELQAFEDEQKRRPSRGRGSAGDAS
jgi:F0F1-type ATP synthase epsilon subunit